MKYTLRPYQSEASDRIMGYIESAPNQRKGIACSGVLVSPTGTGKSLIIADVANRLETPILILQPSKELLEQNFEKYLSYDNPASIYSGSFNSKEIDHVTFGTPMSVVENIEGFREAGVKVVIIDECHLGTKNGGVIADILNGLSRDRSIVVIGVTATPLELKINRMYGAYLQIMTRSRDNLFKDIIHIIQIPDIVNQGYWADLSYRPQEVDTKRLVLNSSGNDYTDISMIEHYEYNDLEDRIVNETKALIFDDVQSILVFVPTIDQAKALYRRIPGSAMVHSKMTPKQRRIAVENFKSGFSTVGITVRAIETGFDYPGLEAVIMARPTNSLAIYYQQIGRACRPHPDKESAIIVDFSGNYSRFGELENITFREWKGRMEMFNGSKRLTNVPQDRGEDEPYTGKNFRNDELIKVWFGNTYKGKTVKDLPPHYMQWLLENFEFRDDKSKIFKQQLQWELNRRKQNMMR